MNNKFSLWFCGYLCVEIKGAGIERFINLCVNNKLYLYNIEKYDNRITFNIDIKSYKKSKKIVKKIHVVPKIIGKYGWPFLVLKINERKSFWIGILLALLIFYMCSLFLWDIRIDGEHYYKEDEIIKYLKEEDIKWGMLIRNIECDKIETGIRNKYRDIGWVSVQVNGTRLIIRIKENIRFEKNNVDVNFARHILSPVDGRVKELFIKEGEPCVMVGEEVKKGQILVKGIMDIIDDSGKVINKHGIYADANIGIIKDKEYFYNINRQYNKKIYTKTVRRKIKLIWQDNQVYNVWPLFSIKKFDNFDIMVNNYNVGLGPKLKIPLEVSISKEREYKLKKDKYSKKELLDKANKYYYRYKKELNDDNVSILDSRIEHYIDNNSLYSKGYVTLLYKKMDYKEVNDRELFVDTSSE